MVLWQQGERETRAIQLQGGQYGYDLNIGLHCKLSISTSISLDTDLVFVLAFTRQSNGRNISTSARQWKEFYPLVVALMLVSGNQNVHASMFASFSDLFACFSDEGDVS